MLLSPIYIPVQTCCCLLNNKLPFNMAMEPRCHTSQSENIFQLLLMCLAGFCATLLLLLLVLLLFIVFFHVNLSVVLTRFPFFVVLSSINILGGLVEVSYMSANSSHLVMHNVTCYLRNKYQHLFLSE